MTRTRTTVWGGAIAGALALAIGAGGGQVNAADHVDAPTAADDAAADITDLYAWAEGDSVYMVLAFAGLAEAGEPALYDADVLYGFHIDNDGDAIADKDIWVRFGQADTGEWGMQVVGLAGTDALIGPVEQTVEGPLGQRAWAGLRDDPFFFDLEGFQDTLGTGTLSFDNSRDFFAGVNVTAIVVQASLDAVSGGESFTMWATTRRE